jgi:hypothetical protein
MIHLSRAEAYFSMLRLSVSIDLEGYDNSKMAASAALRIAFLSSSVGSAIRGWQIHEMTLVEEGNAAFDELRAEVDSAGDDEPPEVEERDTCRDCSGPLHDAHLADVEALVRREALD